MHFSRFIFLGLLALPSVGGTAAEPKNSPNAPKLDVNRIVNDSYGFLKNREPEMTATEYALYDKVVSLISTRPEYAMKLLETMMGDKQQMTPAFEFVLGNAYYAGNKLEPAIAHLSMAVEKYPDFLRAWVNLGMAYYTSLRFAEAAPCLAKAISLGDRAPSTYGVLAYCLFRADNILGAEMAYMQAFAIEPDNTDWIQGLAELYIASKQYARAEALARQLVRLKPGEGKNWLLHANILLAEQQNLDALAVLETGSRLGVIDNAGVLLLGDLYVQQGFYPEAVATYNQAMTQAPETGAERLLNYANALIATQQLPQAQRIIDGIQPAENKRIKIHLLESKAALYSARKEIPQTQKALEDLLLIDSLHGNALLGLAEICSTAGNPTKARLLYEQASELPEFAFTANLELANLALAAKDFSKSIAHIRKALSIQKSPALLEYLAKVTALTPAYEN